jgi:hypothetical protein
MKMPGVRIRIVRMGGGYLKAILLDRQESVFGRDEREIFGKLKLIGIREPVPVQGRKKAT